MTITNTLIKSVHDGNDDGLNLGDATTDKVGFYGVTPIVQRSGKDQAAVDTTAATSTEPYGFSSTQANAIIALVNEIRAALVAIGIIKGSA
jgi:hypothetical protein